MYRVCVCIVVMFIIIFYECVSVLRFCGNGMQMHVVCISYLYSRSLNVNIHVARSRARFFFLVPLIIIIIIISRETTTTMCRFVIYWMGTHAFNRTALYNSISHFIHIYHSVWTVLWLRKVVFPVRVMRERHRLHACAQGTHWKAQAQCASSVWLVGEYVVMMLCACGVGSSSANDAAPRRNSVSRSYWIHTRARFVVIILSVLSSRFFVVFFFWIIRNR